MVPDESCRGRSVGRRFHRPRLPPPEPRRRVTSTSILGISAFYHDSAACLVRDGEIVAAAQEERFTRRKGDPDFPRHAVAYCLRAGGIT